MKVGFENNWIQPAVPDCHVVENIGDIAAVYAASANPTAARFWSPPDAASIHGVLWFVGLQQLAAERFPEWRPVVVLDCGDRADFAHAALHEGLLAICFRGSPGMLAKLRAIADSLGACIETRHPTRLD
ncbi:MAG TPA: hypothetical protein VM639_21185 [Dongiaceae bacterium]|nr:hypothetical protein [Dongiaceae bacterium]